MLTKISQLNIQKQSGIIHLAQYCQQTMAMQLKQIKVFLLTFFGYASLTAIRYGWSYTKAQLGQAFDIPMKTLGIVDAFYIMCYAFGFVVLGSFAHKTTLKNYVIIGILMSSLSYMFFPIFYSITSIYSLTVIIFFMSICGFFQAAVYPGLMGIFGNWFQKSKKGVIMAVWIMSGNVGSIFASNACNVLEDLQFSWIANIMLTGLAGIIVAASIYLFLESSSPNENEKNQLSSNDKIPLKQDKKQDNEELKFGVFELLAFPKVPAYVIGLSSLKGCVYGMIFWLPTFIDFKGPVFATQRGFISSMVEVGGLIGIFGLGYFADKFDKRALLLSPLLIASSFIMFLVAFALTEPWQYYVGFFLMGISTVGPYNMICTVITLDLGQRINRKDSVTKISSLIEGVAAFVSAIEMIIIPYIPFDSVFYLFSLQCVIAACILFPLFLEDLRSFSLNKVEQGQMEMKLVNYLQNGQKK